MLQLTDIVAHNAWLLGHRQRVRQLLLASRMIDELNREIDSQIIRWHNRYVAEMHDWASRNH
jgi:hypothetical protein